MRLRETLPKTRGLTPIPTDSAPSGPNTAEAENKAIRKYRCNPPPQMYLPTWQNANLQKPKFMLVSERKPSKRLFLSLAASCTYRSYLRLSLPSPDGLDTAGPDEEQTVTAKEFRPNMR